MAAEDKSEPKTESAGGAEEAPYPNAGYAWFVVGVLMVLYTFSFIDRIIMYFMVEPIKRDLGLNDFKMGLLLGPSFAVLYSLFGIPFGRLADRHSRKMIISAGLFTWTIMTAGCGLARNYIQLFFMRVGVGVGEATLSPAAYSTIADYFPPSKHGRAFSLYAMGITIGAGLASGIGGIVVGWTERAGSMTLPVIGEIYSWQVAFLLIGIAGLAPLLLMLAIKEPVRRGVALFTDARGRSRPRQVPLREYFSFQKMNLKAITCHHLGASILAFSGYGVGAWAPAFMIRMYDWSYERIGILFMLHVILAGCGGMFFGGWWCDRMFRQGKQDAPLRIGLIAAIIWFPTGALFPLMPNGWMAWGLMVPTYFLASMPTGVLAAALQNMNPNTMRGTASAVLLLVTNLIGQVLGPMAIPIFTDFVFADPMKLHYSIVIVSVACHLIAIPAFYIGMKEYPASVKRAAAYAAPAA